MSDKKIVKFNRGELTRVEKFLDISNKLVGVKSEYEIIVFDSNLPFNIKGFTKSGLVEIKGKALFINTIQGENMINKPVIEWIKKCLHSGISNISINFHLESINTIAFHPILGFLKEIGYLQKDHSIMINWFYLKEDEDMMQTGNDYSDISGIPIRLKEQI